MTPPAPADWFLYSLLRPEAVYVYLYESSAPSRPVSFPLAGIDRVARQRLERLLPRARVPDDILPMLLTLAARCGPIA